MHWDEQTAIYPIDELYKKTVVWNKNESAVKDFLGIYLRLYKIGRGKMISTELFRTVWNWFGMGFDLF